MRMGPDSVPYGDDSGGKKNLRTVRVHKHSNINYTDTVHSTGDDELKNLEEFRNLGTDSPL